MAEGILIVEDDPDIRMDLAELLESQGRSDLSRPLVQKALALLLEALPREKVLRTAENRARVDALLARLDGQALPASLQQRLLRVAHATILHCHGGSR